MLSVLLTNTSMHCKIHVMIHVNLNDYMLIQLYMYNSRMIVIDICHRFTVIHLNEMNVFDQ